MTDAVDKDEGQEATTPGKPVADAAKSNELADAVNKLAVSVKEAGAQPLQDLADHYQGKLLDVLEGIAAALSKGNEKNKKGKQ